MSWFSDYSPIVSATTENLAIAGPAPEIYRLYLLPKITVFAARVNQTVFSYPLAQVTYDGVTTGAFGDVEVGMTVLFGTSAGADDLGRQRIRQAATSTILYFGRSSEGTHDGEVKLEDDAYITVLYDFRPWARIPFLNADGGINKDPDLPVEWRTTNPPPKCNIGCGFGATIDSVTGLITAAWDNDDSFAVAPGATITDYLWDVADGTITVGSTTTAGITATFPAGFRWVSCTITDSEGHSQTMRVPVVARDPAADNCVKPWFPVSRRKTAQGQEWRVVVRQALPRTTYLEGTLAMIWRREPSGPTDRSHMLLPCGWVEEEDTGIAATRTATLGDLSLRLFDIGGALARLPAFPQVVEADDTPDDWMHMASPNANLYLDYLLRWHAAALALANFTLAAEGDEYIFPRLESFGDTLFDQVENLAQSLTPDHHFTVDSLGRMRVVADPMLLDVADRPATTQAAITATDWTEIDYTALRRPRVHRLYSNAVTAHATTQTPIFCVAPGVAGSQGGREQTESRHLARNQTELNHAEGHRYARLNAPYSPFRIQLKGSADLGIEPATLEWVEFSIPANVAAQRGLSFTDERGLPLEVNTRFEVSETGFVRHNEVVWEQETSGPPAVTEVKTPSTSLPDDDYWPGDWPALPPPVGAPPPVPPLPLYQGQEIVCLFDEYGQMFRSWNFTSGGASPTWDRKTLAGLGGSEKVLSFVVDPFSPLYRNTGTTVNAFIATERYIYKVNDLFGTTPTLTELHSFGYVTNPDLDRNRVIQASFGRFFSEETDNPWLIVVSHNGTLSGHEGTVVNYSTDGGATWTGTGINGNSDSYTAEFREPWIGLYLSPKTPGLAYTAAYLPLDETDGFVSEDWGATWTGISDPDIDPQDGLAGDIHVPWPDNDDESVVYHGRWQKGDPLIYRVTRVEGTGQTNISPSYDGHTWGCNRSHFAVRTFDNDRRYVALAGIANDTTDSFADDVFAAFVSNNYGATWTNIVDTLAKTDPHPEAIAFAADTEQVLYLWGSERYIAYSDDFGATIVDKSGNMPTDFPTDIRDIVGFCGGEAPA